MSDIVELMRELRDSNFISGCGDYYTITDGMAEIKRLRAALREIRGWREIGRDDVMRRIEEICEEALGEDEGHRGKTVG